jgi:hypothetical protein
MRISLFRIHRIALLVALAAPVTALAAGSGDSNTTTSPPPTTETTKTCKGVKVWDDKKKRCVNPSNSALDPDTLYIAVRELAYAGRYVDAQGVLAAMPDQSDDRVLTYWGFTWRKLGEADRSRAFYLQAIAANPDNILVRSYMGQGMIAEGDIAGAEIQLAEIRQRGGIGTWPEQSLATALLTGQTYDY